MDSDPLPHMVYFAVPAVKDGKKGFIYTCYVLDGGKAKALEDAAGFVGVCVDSGTFLADETA